MRVLFAGLLSFSLIAPSPLYAAEPLSAALVHAYETNQRLEAAKATVRGSNEGYVQARAGWFPTLSANASAGYIRQQNDINFTGAKETRKPKEVGLELNQPIFRGFRTVAQTDAALAEIGRTRAEYTSEEQQVLLSVVTAYMDVLLATAIVSLNEKNVSVLEENMRATRTRFSVGDVTRTDVAQSESRYATATADLTRARGDLEAARAAYTQVTGRGARSLTAPDVKPNLPNSLQEALDTAMRENPTLLTAVYAEEVSKNIVRREKGSLLPEVGVGAGVSHGTDSSSFGGDTDTVQATARVSVPLFEGGADYSRVRQAKQEQARAKAASLNQRRVVTEQVIKSWEDYQSAKAQITSLQSAIRAAEIALDGVQKESMVGSRTVLDVLDAERELLNVRVTSVRAERDKEVAAYTLMAAIGHMTARRLGLPVAYYDAEADLDSVRDKFFGFGDEVDGGAQQNEQELEPAAVE